MTTQVSNNITMKSIDKAIIDCPDIIRRKVYIDNQYEAFFLFIDEIIDHDILQRDFISPISNMSLKQLSNEINIHNIPCSDLTILYDINEVLDNIMSGNSVFIYEQLPYAAACTLTDFEKRSIEEPNTEKNIRGPHEGFVESLDTNLSILRIKIRNTKLKFKTVTLGVQTTQRIVIAYIDGIANIDIVNGIFDKISKINIDGLSNIGYIEQNVSAHPNSVFPQFLSTERPDKSIAAILEGRIVTY